MAQDHKLWLKALLCKEQVTEISELAEILSAVGAVPCISKLYAILKAALLKQLVNLPSDLEPAVLAEKYRRITDVIAVIDTMNDLINQDQTINNLNEGV